MATAEEIAAFRLMIDETQDKLPYSNDVLSERLDLATGPDALASQIWREKAAAYAALVTVSESGSSRNLSDLHKNALALAETYAKSDPLAPGTGPAVRGVQMKRLTR